MSQAHRSLRDEPEVMTLFKRVTKTFGECAQEKLQAIQEEERAEEETLNAMMKKVQASAGWSQGLQHEREKECSLKKEVARHAKIVHHAENWKLFYKIAVSLGDPELQFSWRITPAEFINLVKDSISCKNDTIDGFCVALQTRKETLKNIRAK